MNILKVLIFSLFLMNIAFATETSKAQVTGEKFLGVPGNSAQIILGKQICSLKSFGEQKKNSFRLEFKCNGITQILFDTEAHIESGKYSVDEPLFSLLWAGDKDYDGKIDLVMEMSPKYSYSKKITFLSTKARNQELLGISNIKRESFD